MEPLFLEGQSPDFSVLQRLLCLEPGPEPTPGPGPGPGLEPGPGPGPGPGPCRDLPPGPGPAADTAAHGWEPQHREVPNGRDPGAPGGSHREGSGSTGRFPTGGIREHREGPIGMDPGAPGGSHREGRIGRDPGAPGMSHREGPIGMDPGAPGRSQREGSGSTGRVLSGGSHWEGSGSTGRVLSGGSHWDGSGSTGRVPSGGIWEHREDLIGRDPGAPGGSHRDGSGSTGRFPTGGIREHREGPIGRVPLGWIREHREGPIGRVPSGGIREHREVPNGRDPVAPGCQCPIAGGEPGAPGTAQPYGEKQWVCPPPCPNSIPRGSSGVLEPPPSPWSPGEGLTFLQETVRLLPPPAPPVAPPATPPEQRSAAPVPPRSPDALSLISLQCQRLAGNGGTGRRKQAAPQRGAGPGDPSFRGVTLRMRLDLRSSSAEGCGLLITARGSRAPKWSSPGAGASSSEKNAPVAQGSKRCASCGTRRTLLWRAAEDGTPLCNACGIRYRRYRVRCRRCWNIPGKSRTPRSQCPRCGERCPPAGK